MPGGRRGRLAALAVLLALAAPAAVWAEATPAPAISFNGLGGVHASTPLDPNLAVSTTRVVQATNDGYAVFDHHGVRLASASLGSLWASVNDACATGDGDPIVLYDASADRFVLSQMATPGPYYECIAVSNTADPTTGGWTAWAFELDPAVFQDYPKLAVWGGSYYLTTIRFLLDSSGQPTLNDGTALFAFDRQAMLAGAPNPRMATDVTRFQSNPMLAASVVDGGADPTVPEYVLASDASRSLLQVWRASVDWAAASPQLTVTSGGLVPVDPFSAACGADDVCIPQPFTGVRLDAISDRLMNALPYRRFLDHTSIVASQTTATGTGTRTGVRWYELAAPISGPLTVRQSGTWAPTATSRWMGSASINAQGDVALGYSASSTTVAPSIRYAVHAAADAPGTVRAEATAVAGAGTQTGRSAFPDRWGDYSGMAVDPSDGCTFWYTNQFLGAIDGPLLTRVVAFRLPTCSGTDAIDSAPASIGSANRPHGFLRGTRITGSWPGASDASGASAPGYAVVVDHAANGDVPAVDAGPATTGTWSVADGSWYVHVRAHFADGSWSGTATAGPFIVDHRCTIGGTDANDVLVGTSAHDVICGFGGNDRITAGVGDVVYGGAGNDRITSRKGGTRLYGEGGNDTFVTANGHRDTIDGGAGRNTAIVDRYDVVHRIAVLHRR